MTLLITNLLKMYFNHDLLNLSVHSVPDDIYITSLYVLLLYLIFFSLITAGIVNNNASSLLEYLE